MRKSTWLALGLVFALGTAAKAQSGPGFFGFLPDLFGGKDFNADKTKPPIPVQVRNSNPRLIDFLPKLNLSLRKQQPVIMTLPDASQINQEEYLTAFHYTPPKRVQ
jgi:hypothetical protein